MLKTGNFNIDPRAPEKDLAELCREQSLSTEEKKVKDYILRHISYGWEEPTGIILTVFDQEDIQQYVSNAMAIAISKDRKALDKLIIDGCNLFVRCEPADMCLIQAFSIAYAVKAPEAYRYFEVFRDHLTNMVLMISEDARNTEFSWVHWMSDQINSKTEEKHQRDRNRRQRGAPSNQNSYSTGQTTELGSSTEKVYSEEVDGGETTIEATNSHLRTRAQRMTMLEATPISSIATLSGAFKGKGAICLS